LGRLLDCRFGRYDFIFRDSSGFGFCFRCQSFYLGLSVYLGQSFYLGLSVYLGLPFYLGLSISLGLQRHRSISFIGCTFIFCRLAFDLSTTLLLDHGCACIRKCCHCRCNVAVCRVEGVCVGQYNFSRAQIANVDL
jgi:hypothetical protein